LSDLSTKFFRIKIMDRGVLKKPDIWTKQKFDGNAKSGKIESRNRKHLKLCITRGIRFKVRNWSLNNFFGDKFRHYKIRTNFWASESEVVRFKRMLLVSISSKSSNFIISNSVTIYFKLCNIKICHLPVIRDIKKLGCFI
jgi:hypothetical protein